MTKRDERRSNAEYIANMGAELARLAEKNGFNMGAYLLRVASLEFLQQHEKLGGRDSTRVGSA